ncbi:hypothetical protein FDP41_009991 [Naegleria fowleri]|uniref:SUN domain-containing protein n=1 Tax=Naegleria fowleri TaxID=5763 RepID=A0A6A5BCP2_NAEFO|nr:uncharacterized protein FDP41_009991 [Naegleria fowleri]KAF0971768.1 hypothetical protein FDP41_009991 [Naegleria fowleri]
MSNIVVSSKPSSTTSTADAAISSDSNSRSKHDHQHSPSMEHGGIIDLLCTNTSNDYRHEEENEDVDLLLGENIKHNNGRNSSVKRKKTRLTDAETKKRKIQSTENNYESADDTSSEHQEEFERGNATSPSELDLSEKKKSRSAANSPCLKDHKYVRTTKTSPKNKTDSLKLIHLSLPVYNGHHHKNSNNYSSDKTKTYSLESTGTSQSHDVVAPKSKNPEEDTPSSSKMVVISIIFIFTALVYIMFKYNQMHTQIESMGTTTAPLPEDQRKVFENILQNQISDSQKQFLDLMNIKLSDLEKRVNIEFEKNMNNNILSINMKNQKDLENIKDLVLNKIFSEIDKVLENRLGPIIESHREDVVKLKEEIDNIFPSVKSLIDDSLSKYAADKIGLADYALSSLGSKVVEHSPTYNPSSGFWPLFSSIKRPDIILTTDTTIGNCWPMKGGSGFVVIELASPIIPTAFSIDHVPRSLTPNFSSAPRQFTVFAYESSTSLAKLHTFEYDIKGPATQTFYIVEKVTRKYQRFRFQISSNYGNHLYTCLYRLRIHGESGNYLLN